MTVASIKWVLVSIRAPVLLFSPHQVFLVMKIELKKKEYLLTATYWQKGSCSVIKKIGKGLTKMVLPVNMIHSCVHSTNNKSYYVWDIILSKNWPDKYYIPTVSQFWPGNLYGLDLIWRSRVLRSWSLDVQSHWHYCPHCGGVCIGLFGPEAIRSSNIFVLISVSGKELLDSSELIKQLNACQSYLVL